MLKRDARRCPRCFMPNGCICDAIPKLKPRTEVIVVQHALEMFKTSNTARLAVIALARASLKIYGAKGIDFDEAALVAPDTAVLFPEDAAQPLPKPKRLIVVDGSWSQARRMSQKISALRRLPRFSLPPAPAETARLRQPPTEQGMSTLEAIAYALKALEGEALSRPLLELHSEHSRRILTLRGLRKPSVEEPSG
ncbi:MAG: tRNA-uridine aminocarboxypropyltransferase [Myxococcaceae bacterium]